MPNSSPCGMLGCLLLSSVRISFWNMRYVDGGRFGFWGSLSFLILPNALLRGVDLVAIVDPPRFVLSSGRPHYISNVSSREFE